MRRHFWVVFRQLPPPRVHMLIEIIVDKQTFNLHGCPLLPQRSCPQFCGLPREVFMKISRGLPRTDPWSSMTQNEFEKDMHFNVFASQTFHPFSGWISICKLSKIKTDIQTSSWTVSYLKIVVFLSMEKNIITRVT